MISTKGLNFLLYSPISVLIPVPMTIPLALPAAMLVPWKHGNIYS